jgi:hypothetical protein
MAGFRRFIIRIVEVLLIIFVVVSTLFSALSGFAYGQMIGSGGAAVVLFLISGLVGFAFAAVLAAAYFLLAEIAENTRRP